MKSCTWSMPKPGASKARVPPEEADMAGAEVPREAIQALGADLEQ